MNRASKAFSAGSCLGLLALCLSCSASPAAADARARSPETLPRRAPGVAEQPAEVRPEPASSGSTRDQWLVLQVPAASSLAREAVRDFLRAAVNEAPERMDPLLSPQAVVDTGSGKQLARAFWQSRFTVLDYTELRGQLLFREADLEIFRAQDVPRLPAARRPPIELSGDEVAVRVPIRISWAGRARLFGDELLFRLQPAGTRYEIAEIDEEFRLP